METFGRHVVGHRGDRHGIKEEIREWHFAKRNVSQLEEVAQQLRQVIRSATEGLIAREQLAELIILSAVAQEHLLVVGPPGTAKSAVVRGVAQALGGRYFEYLLGRFTEPSEIFGAVDLRKLREGSVETDTTGMLPEADVAFLDEVFLGSTAILNSLLGILNERSFRRGHTTMACPLRLCVGAANSVPEDEELAPFADRFLVRVFIDPVPDQHLEALLQGGWQRHASDQHTPAIALAALDHLTAQVRQVDMAQARPALASAIRQLRQSGILLSDRRIVKAQLLVAASAVMAGRLHAQPCDLWPLIYVLPNRELQLTGKEVLSALLAGAAHPHLHGAVEEAALQPMARASRLEIQAKAVLAEPEASRAGKVEPLLREIDANFSANALPEALAGLRQQLRQALLPAS